MSDILRSCYSLAKYNNGAFKSEKQAAFLSRSLNAYGGVFTESFSFGEFGGARAECTVVVQWDEKGIVSIVRTSSTKKTTVFCRNGGTGQVEKLTTTKRVKKVKKQHVSYFQLLKDKLAELQADNTPYDYQEVYNWCVKEAKRLNSL